MQDFAIHSKTSQLQPAQPRRLGPSIGPPPDHVLRPFVPLADGRIVLCNLSDKRAHDFARAERPMPSNNHAPCSSPFWGASSAVSDVSDQEQRLLKLDIETDTCFPKCFSLAAIAVKNLHRQIQSLLFIATWVPADKQRAVSSFARPWTIA